MEFWRGGSMLTALIIVGLLLGCELLARLVPALRRVGVPLAIIAGVAGLTLGEQVLGGFTLDVELLERTVYHGLGILFISLSLRAPLRKPPPSEPGTPSRPAIAMAFAITAAITIQAIVALATLLVLDASLHPGFAMLLPMGFEEGPGQALAMGAAWESSGLRDGAQLGLIIAAIGYGWAVVAGIPLAVIGRRKGWLSGATAELSDARETVELRAPDPGGLDPLSIQLALIGGCYLLTYAWCSLLASLFAGMPDIAATVWGFHFIFGAGIAMGVRALIGRVTTVDSNPIDDRLMGRVGGLTVDVVTCAALAAIQIAVLRAYWLPIAVITGVGGLATLVFTVWIGRRAWTEAPFEHTVLWFGMSTGTLPTGLALLKVVDPDMRSPAAVSAVLGSAAAVLGVAPLLLIVIPATVKAFDAGWPGSGWLMLGGLVVYAGAVMVLWRLLGGLRMRGRVTELWPDDEA